MGNPVSHARSPGLRCRNPVPVGISGQSTHLQIGSGCCHYGPTARREYGRQGSPVWDCPNCVGGNGDDCDFHRGAKWHAGLSHTNRSLVTLVMMQLGEVILGGIGSGLSGMVILVLIAVFISGLMV